MTMRIMLALGLALLGCSSTPLDVSDAGDGGDAGCPPGPFYLGSQTTDPGVPPDPNTGCPSDYCFECQVLDWAQECPNMICLKTAPDHSYPGQCHPLCDAGADAATSD